MTAPKRIIMVALLVAASFGLWQAINPFFVKKHLDITAATLINSVDPITSFNLTDSEGRPFTEKTLRGKWTLIFFGYTDCPDICPATLSIVRETWNTFLPNKQPPANFIFASINPIDDTKQQLKQFLANFHEKFIGITGEKQEMNRLSAQLGIFASTSDEKSAKGKPIIDHTAALFLIDPQMRLKAVFTPPHDHLAIVDDLKTLTKS
jgi:protein SCO1